MRRPERVAVPVASSELRSGAGRHPGRRPGSPRHSDLHVSTRIVPYPAQDDGELTRRVTLIVAIQTELVAQVQRRTEVAVDEVPVGLQRERRGMVTHPALQA